MSIIDEALSANATIANDYEPSRVKPPAPKIAIVTCADPRLTIIEHMLGLAADDVDMIRNFGTVIDDDAVRSLVLSTRLLGTREIMIINHTDCGMLRFTDSEFEDRLRKETGQAPIAPARFYSFTDAEANTKEQIQKARSHPWISQDVPARGFVYDVSTGRLSEFSERVWRFCRYAQFFLMPNSQARELRKHPDRRGPSHAWADAVPPELIFDPIRRPRAAAACQRSAVTLPAAP